MTYGHGFGFRGASPSWPYVGRGRGGLPRCLSPETVIAPGHTSAFSEYPGRGQTLYTPKIPGERELDFLKEESNALKRQLEKIEARITKLEATEPQKE